MSKWTTFPQIGEYTFDAVGLERHWVRLHTGDAEPLPTEASVLDAWVLFHNGEFQRCVLAGLKAGGAGITVANKATCIYANYLEKKEKTRLDLFLEVAQRAEAQIANDAKNPNAHYWLAYALGRYSQGISVAKALAQGLGRAARAWARWFRPCSRIRSTAPRMPRRAIPPWAAVVSSTGSSDADAAQRNYRPIRRVEWHARRFLCCEWC